MHKIEYSVKKDGIGAELDRVYHHLAWNSQVLLLDSYSGDTQSVSFRFLVSDQMSYDEAESFVGKHMEELIDRVVKGSL